MGLGYPREKLLSQRCKLHLGEEPDDAGEIQKMIKFWAQNDLPASDAVNPCNAGVVSVPGWCEVLTGSLTHSELPERRNNMTEHNSWD